jgi:putative hydrolase of the HAD superfamily
MVYIGDEEKDIVGANKLGIPSILVNRSNDIKAFGQKHTINSLSDIVGIIDNYNSISTFKNSYSHQ